MRVGTFMPNLKPFIASRKKQAKNALIKLYLIKLRNVAVNDCSNFLDSRVLNAPSITHATMERYAIFNDSFCFIPLLYKKTP